MKYEVIDGTEKGIRYQVTDQGEKVAEFCYHPELGLGSLSLFMDFLEIAEGYSDTKHFDAVLQFIKYKCQTEGGAAVYCCINIKNRNMLLRYQQFGFHVIDIEPNEADENELHYVLKYRIPEWEEDSN